MRASRHACADSAGQVDVLVGLAREGRDGVGGAALAHARKVDLPAIRFALARALWASGARARALELARRARDDLSSGRERERVDRWLRSRR